MPRKGKTIGETARRRHKFPPRRAGTGHNCRAHSLRRRRKQSTRRAAHAAAAAPVASTCFCPAVPCSGLVCLGHAGGDKHTLLSPLPHTQTHIFGLCNRPSVRGQLWGRALSAEAPHWLGVQLRGTSPKTPLKLNIDQHLFQRAWVCSCHGK